MRMQFLGDSRDAFKWDLLHQVVTGAVPRFAGLVVVPMRTPDDAHLSHGKTPAARFPCHPAILRFVEGLRTEPRELERIAGLGAIEGLPAFPVQVFEPQREFGFGWRRAQYWQDLTGSDLDGKLVFLDPDNGFESAGTAGTRHVRFGEADFLLRSLPPTSALCVFHYRPQGQSWDLVFGRIEAGIPADTAMHSIYNGQLGFVFLSGPATGTRIKAVLSAYRATHAFLHGRSCDAG